jgi:pimeloyl-ACP methyl ester carboxylesterase
MNLLLIHGQGRTTNALRLLGRRLQRRGHRVRYFRYYTRREIFSQIVARLVVTIQALPQDQPYALIGHSMGGLLARASLPALSAHPPVHLIMLASPSRPPRMAPLMQHNLLYRYFTNDCGQRVVTAEFYESLPKPEIPTTIIAGTGGPRSKWFPLAPEPNDSILTVQETQLEPEHTVILVPALHTFIMNSRETFQHIDRILRESSVSYLSSCKA